ncbi:DUF4365 domain-containing protein [Sphingobacterium sp. ML3W]|uniref:DUF4365 domain-containing protein n=1 Tax=Sphingobacterium sp. ML3W TaxID=1538644 RepID=UPI00249BC4E3|nr:DUF4365 domain-containing protein [Sphingobacterium sp. ML3W]WFA80397.1 DUF4365 domain-containing protein [Sphingobacterium sp. ML3W]
MEKIIDANPASFPPKNPEEMNSVFTLGYLLDTTFLKPEFNYLDKFPNIDGYITIVNEREQPIGKVEVQIKTLPDNLIGNPKFQCPKEFLSYCESAPLPVMLIVVNKKFSKAFWLNIDRNFLNSLKIKGDTVSLKFPLTQVISLKARKYIKEWKLIVAEHLRRLVYFPLLETKHKALQEKYDYLKSFPKPVHNLPPQDFSQLQSFIDTYNNLVMDKFPILKELYYAEFWKIGIGYSSFLDKSINYLLYPIRYGENDLLIREISEEEILSTPKAISWHNQYVENPIKDNPIRYAWDQVSNDIIEVVSEPIVKLVSFPLATEFLIAQIDKVYFILNQRMQNKYNLSTILERLNLLYPLWLDEVYGVDDNQEVEFSYIQLHDLVERDTGRNGLLRAILKYRKGVKKKNNVDIKRFDIDEDYLNTSIKMYRSINQNVIKRLYPPNNYSKRVAGLNYIWNFISPEEFQAKVHNIYNFMPALIDEYVSLYLPFLKGQIKYFDNFDLHVINIDFNGGKGFGDGPTIEHFYLKALGPFSPLIKTYLNGVNSPLTWGGRLEMKVGTIEIDSVDFRIISSGWSASHEELSESAIEKIFNNLIKEKVTEYFQIKLKELT